jgi:hypothetical protein
MKPNPLRHDRGKVLDQYYVRRAKNGRVDTILFALAIIVLLYGIGVIV